ncbi:tyrosine-type recombinase/integrase [Xanthobacteraceae bacterium A53D]
MPTVKFTKASVAALALEPGQKEALFFDEAMPGFGIRMQGDAARWIAQYRVNGATRRVSLGKRETLSLEKARAAAKEVLSKAGLGIDTQHEKKAARRAATQTLGAAAEKYLAEYEQAVRHNTYRGARLHLLIHMKPLHGVQLDKLGHRDIAERLSAIRQENGRSTADHTRIALSGLYAWAISEGLANANPVMNTRSSRAAKARNGETANGGRDRTLSAGELAEVWRACRADHFGHIVKLLILTAQRRVEIASLGWEEIEGIGDDWQISLPPARTKNGRDHLVPLSAAAMQVLAPIEREPDRDFLFGTTVDGPFSGFSKAKRALDERIMLARREATPDAKAMPAWTLHDLRRTAATFMNESPPLGMGIQPHIVEAILNHVSGTRGGVAGVYNKAVYLAEKRDALERWGAHVMSIVSPPASEEGETRGR